MDTNHIAQRLLEVWPQLMGADGDTRIRADKIFVDAPVLLSAGWESDIYAIAYHTPGAERVSGTVVARLYFGHEAGQKAQRERALLACLVDAGYPCPTPLWVDATDVPWGRPALVMTLAPGAPMWKTVYRGDAAVRAAAHAAYVNAFAQLHGLDVQATRLDVVLDAPEPEHAVMAELERTRAFIAACPDIGFAPALDWLQQAGQTVSRGRVGLLHWDFHPENLLMDDAGRVTVIDWSGAEIGDTRYDVAWSMVVVGSQEGPEAAAQLLDAYSSRAGPQPDMEFFLAFAYVRRLFVMAMALLHGAETLGLRPGAEEAIRRQIPALRHLYARWLDVAAIPLAALEDIQESDTKQE